MAHFSHFGNFSRFGITLLDVFLYYFGIFLYFSKINDCNTIIFDCHTIIRLKCLCVRSCACAIRESGGCACRCVCVHAGASRLTNVHETVIVHDPWADELSDLTQSLNVRLSYERTRATSMVFNVLQLLSEWRAQGFCLRFYLYARYLKRARLYAGACACVGGGYFLFMVNSSQFIVSSPHTRHFPAYDFPNFKKWCLYHVFNSDHFSHTSVCSEIAILELVDFHREVLKIKKQKVLFKISHF